MSYWGDILDDEDKRMDYECNDPHKSNAPKLFTVKAKSKVSGADLSQSTEMTKGKVEGAVDFKHKTEIKKKFDDEHSLKLTTTSKDYEAEYDFKPAQLNKDGLNSQLEVKAKCTPSKKEWEGSAEFKVGGFELGPIVPYTELQFETNQSSTKTLTYSQNLVYEKNIHCAWKIKHDLSKLTEAYGLLAMMNTSLGHFYFRSNCLNRFVGLGCAYTINKNAHHATEVQWDFGKTPAKGLFGQPLFWRFGGVYHLENGAKGTVHVKAGEQFLFTQKWDFPINKQTKVVFSDQIDFKAAIYDPKSAAFNFGFSVEYSL